MKDVERGLSFYRDLLGFKLIEDFRYENKPVYARLTMLPLPWASITRISCCMLSSVPRTFVSKVAA